MALKLDQSHPKEETHQALKQMIDRFARIGMSGARQWIETGPDGYAALRKILLEIDETMLPRCIVVRFAQDRQICLYASNRRLLAIEGALEGNSVVPKAVPNSPQSSAEIFADTLLSFVAGTKTLSIQTKKLAPSLDAGVSVSTDLLAQALGLNDTWKSADPVDGFNALREASIASLYATSCLSFSGEDGPEAELNQLKTFWCEFMRDAAPQFENWGTHDGKRECRAFGLGHGTYLVVIRLNHASWFVSLLPRTHLNDLTLF